MMKKIFVLMMVLVLAAMPAMAEEYTAEREKALAAMKVPPHRRQQQSCDAPFP